MSGKQTFNVPNNSEGREFLRLLKKFKAPGHSFRARGRGPRKAPGDNYVSFSRQMNLPHADAESFAVYMGKRVGTTFIMDEQLDYKQQSLLGRAERGELQKPLTAAERNGLAEAIHGFVDDNNLDLEEGDYDLYEAINAKLGLWVEIG
jgi:hypothetical protein